MLSLVWMPLVASACGAALPGRRDIVVGHSYFARPEGCNDYWTLVPPETRRYAVAISADGAPLDVQIRDEDDLTWAVSPSQSLADLELRAAHRYSIRVSSCRSAPGRPLAGYLLEVNTRLRPVRMMSHDRPARGRFGDEVHVRRVRCTDTRFETRDAVWGFTPREDGVYVFESGFSFHDVLGIVNAAGATIACGEDNVVARLEGGAQYAMVAQRYVKPETGLDVVYDIEVRTAQLDGEVPLGQTLLTSMLGATDQHEGVCDHPEDVDRRFEITIPEIGLYRISVRGGLSLRSSLTWYGPSNELLACVHPRDDERASVALTLAPGRHAFVIEQENSPRGETGPITVRVTPFVLERRVSPSSGADISE